MSSNLYPKSEAVAAAKATIIAIDLERDQAKRRIIAGRSHYTIFGRKLSDEEVWEKVPELEYLATSMLGLAQEGIAQGILLMAEHCVGDTISLGSGEFLAISNHWPEKTSK